MSAPMPSVPSTTGFVPAHRAGVADRVVHVRARVVGDRARQRTVEVHAVDEQPVVGGEVLQPGAGGDVVEPLGHVDVHADAEVGGQSGGGRQRVVGAGERGVHPDHAAAAGAQVALVLRQTAAGAVGAVAVGDAVRGVQPHADLGAGVGEDRQAALDARRRLVVVDDRRGPALQRLGGGEHRRPTDDLLVERHVEPPPDLLEHLEERRRLLRRRRHAPGERRVQVVVAADEAGGHVRHASILAAAPPRSIADLRGEW